MLGFFRKSNIPDQLNICMTSYKFPLSERTSEYGFLFPIAKGLVQAGHKVTVISSQSNPTTFEMVKDGVQIHFIDPKLQRRTNFPTEVRRKFSELHKLNRFHIVHSLDSSGSPIARRRKLYKLATAFDVRGTQLSQMFSILSMKRESLSNMLKTDFVMVYKFLRTYWGTDRKVLKSADAVFVSSPAERIALERYYYYPDARMFTVPYGVQFKSDIDIQAIEKISHKYNLTSDNQCVVTISDMTSIDSIKNLLKAFQKVSIKKPDARLIILGHGPLLHQLEYEVYSLALGSKVILTGAVTDEQIFDYISVGQVFVNLSSRSTGFEPSLLVAMSQGKTIIGSETSAISSIVEDGIEGFLVRPADIQTLSQLILDIFRGQLNTQEIGKRASLKVKDLFDTDKMVKTTIDAYKKILNRSHY
ncbi:MAG: glycosyltransferase family 4 protein [Bdellovibrionota bacterium]